MTKTLGERFDEMFPPEKGLYNTESGWRIRVDPKEIKSFFRVELESLAKRVEGNDKEIANLIERHKLKACQIADVAEYDETNMTRYVENPLIHSLVFQHIDVVRELSALSEAAFIIRSLKDELK